MAEALTDTGLDLLFRNARTYTAWLDKPVSAGTLREIYDLLRWGPTSANCSPLRIVYIKSVEAKERLRPHLSAGKDKLRPRGPRLEFDEACNVL